MPSDVKDLVSIQYKSSFDSSIKFQTSTDRHAENTQSSSYLRFGEVPISRTCRKVGQHGSDMIVVGSRVFFAKENWERMFSIEDSSTNL